MIGHGQGFCVAWATEVVNTIDGEGGEAGAHPPGPAASPGTAGGFPIPGLPNLPGLPHPPHGRSRPDPETVKRLLAEAREAMRAENFGEAMGKFGAVLGMDSDNEEARAGMRAATLMLAKTIRRRVMPPPPPPSPS